MRCRWALLAFLGSGCFFVRGADTPVLDGPDGLRAFNDLGAYYADKNKPPPTAQALDNLGEGGDTAVHAAQYLLGLFEQSLADETNGRSASTRAVYWGGGSENAAREFRKDLEEKFGDVAKGDTAVPVAIWLIDEEKLPEGPTAGIKVLRRTDSPTATAAFTKILTQPNPNQDVVVGALEEVGVRKLAALQPQVVALENSYRTDIRKAAGEAAKQLGAPTNPEFNPENGFTPALSAFIQKIADRVYTSIPADAKWMDIVYTYPNAQPGRKPAKFHGWLLRSEGDDYVILDWQGLEQRLSQKNTVLTPGTLAATAGELEAKRQQGPGDGIQSLSVEGGLTAQFEPGFITVPEALVGAWSFVRGDKATAAAVLFPCFDAARDDRWIDWATRDLLGNRYHQQMLEEFSLKRDYDSTLAYAQHLSKPIFDGFDYQERAKALAAQLPKRMDDFKTFVLPKPDDWAKQKAAMKRKDQIAFLASHLRLLNCMQMMQPGGISYSDPQHAESFEELEKMAAKSGSWSPTMGTVVINPYNELKGMSLAPSDIELLLPYVSDDDYMPTFSYWRDFHPGRRLHRVSWPVTGLINDVAQQTLVDLGTLDGLDEQGKQAALEKIKAWCSAHEGKSAVDLLEETIRTTKNQRDYLQATQTALQQKQAQLVVLAITRLGDFPKATSDIAEFGFESAAPGLVDQARKWINANPAPKQLVLGQATMDDYGSAQAIDEIRFWSALILLRDGDRTKHEGLDVLQPILDKDDGSFFYPHAIPALLATKDEKLIEVACGVLKKPALLNSPWDTADQIRRLFLAGRPECRDFLLTELKDTTPGDDTETTTGADGKTKTTHPPKSQNIVNLICQWRKDNFQVSDDLPLADQIRKRGQLTDWINAQFALIQQGKTPDMKIDLVSDVPQAQIDAP